MAAGSLTLGGNMSIALGPLGRNGEAFGSVNSGGKIAAMYGVISHSPHQTCASHITHITLPSQVLLLEDARALRRRLTRGLCHRRAPGRELPGVRVERDREDAPLRRGRRARMGEPAHQDARGVHRHAGRAEVGAGLPNGDGLCVWRRHR